MPNIKLLSYVPAERLAPLMKGAIALLYLTRYETFGMTAAEALAAGTPIITCNCTAVREIVGDAGIYVNPEKPFESVDAVLEFSSSSRKRDEFIMRGKSIAATHTWGNCVSRLQRVLTVGQ